MTNPVAAGPTPLGYQYCPRCGFPRYQADRYCGGCDLLLPPVPFGNGPFAVRLPGIHDPQKQCWNCPATAAPDRSYCTVCGADLRTTPVVVPKPRKPVREFRNPPLTVSLIILAVQVPLLVVLYLGYTRDRSVTNLIFVTGIAVSGVANVINAIGLAFRSSGRKPR